MKVYILETARDDEEYIPDIIGIYSTQEKADIALIEAENNWVRGTEFQIYDMTLDKEN